MGKIINVCICDGWKEMEIDYQKSRVKCKLPGDLKLSFKWWLIRYEGKDGIGGKMNGKLVTVCVAKLATGGGCVCPQETLSAGLPWWSVVRIGLPRQGTRVPSLAGEDPTGHRATKPVHHGYWACMPRAHASGNKRSAAGRLPHTASRG